MSALAMRLLSGKSLLRSLLMVVPWLALVGVAIHWWIRLPMTDPQFAIKHAPMDVALRALVEPRHYDADWDNRVRRAHPRDASALREILKSDHDQFRWVAASALGDMKDSKSVDDLIWLLQGDPSFQVRYTAARALAEIGDERAIVPLLAAMSDPDTVVRNIAVESLGTMKATQAISAIEAFKQKHDYLSAQAYAERALELLRGSDDATPRK
jgi:HEAT repeat protein